MLSTTIVVKVFAVCVLFYINGERTRSRYEVLQLVNYTCVMFKDGETIYIEPWRCAAFPVIERLDCGPVVIRPYSTSWVVIISVNTSGHTVRCEHNSHSINEDADEALDAADLYWLWSCVSNL